MKAKLYVIPALFFACLLGGPVTKAQYISTYAGNGYGAGTGTGSYTGDGGVAVYATLNSPSAVTFDGAGNIYIADAHNHVVRKVVPTGIITTVAGTGTAGYSGDGGMATAAKLNDPNGVAVDVAGNVFIADRNNVIRKVSTAGVISTYAGTGTAGYSGDNGHADSAQLNDPRGMAIDAYGTLFVADAGNHVIRRIDTARIITTVAGTGAFGYSGNGGAATAAKLNFPTDVAVDVFGNLYIADYWNQVVRKVDAIGNISTIAGNTVIGFGGDGALATNANLHFPSGVSVDAARNVYIADQGNSRVRKVDTMGIITNFAGTISNGYSGDGGLATAARLSAPKDVTADGWGRVYIADYDNNVIRVVASTVINGIATVETKHLDIYPNPTPGNIEITLAATSAAPVVTVMDMAGKVVVTQVLSGKSVTISNLIAGTYIVKVTDGGTIYRKVVTVIK
jgi:sugar lactone lactonase YvrE